jgi:hypothetical protein
MSARFAASFLALPFGLLCGLAAGPVAAHARPPEPIDVATCISYDEVDVAERAFDVRISSNCAKAVRCKVEWELSCRPDQSPTKRSQSFTVRPNEHGSARISAQMCKADDDWAIDDLSWYCKEL